MLIAAFLAAAYIFTVGIFNINEFNFPSFAKSLKAELFTKVEVITPKPMLQSTEQNSGNQTDESVSASGGEALGKITQRFINPYGANTSYSKVFLKNNTGTAIDISSLLAKKLSFNLIKSTEPQVLIIHTHTTESFMLEDRDYYTADDASRRLEEDKNMIAIGDAFEAELIKHGIGVVHDTTVHDHPSYSGSYNRSAETVLKDLKAYPDIKIVIDIHRDAISGEENEKVRPVTDINGKQYAQVMLVMGSETGEIKNHPNWQNNLSLAVKYQQALEVKYPGLARAITLNSAKYNQQISKGMLLLEVGSEANTLSEAKLSATAAADALSELFS